MKFRLLNSAVSIFILLAGFISYPQNLMAAESAIAPPAPPLPPGEQSSNDTPAPVIKSTPAKKNTATIKSAPTPPDKKKKRSNRPEVTIVAKKHEVWAEYRINDTLYMIKVSPRSRTRKPYYLIDQHGDGVFVRSNFKPKNTIPEWALKRTN